MTLKADAENSALNMYKLNLKVYSHKDSSVMITFRRIGIEMHMTI